MNKIKIPLLRFSLPVLLMGILITSAAIYYRQSWILVLPLYVSLFVMILSSQVNRYSFLVGGLNSIIYSFVFFRFGLYGMMAQAILLSFPLQIVSFVRWNKNLYKQSVYLKKLTKKQLIAVFAVFIIAWVLMHAVLNKLHASYAPLDNTITLFGILTAVLAMLAFIEYTYLSVINGFIQIILYVQMIKSNPQQTIYLIFSVYSLLCIIVQFINAKKLYSLQKNKSPE